MAQIPDATIEIKQVSLKWEYQVQSLRDFPLLRIEDCLESYGLDGWELTAVDNGIAYFKRPIWNPE